MHSSILLKDLLYPATQCHMGCDPQEVMERFDSESPGQPLWAWHFLQSAEQGCSAALSLMFLMSAITLLYKHRISGKPAWSGIHSAGLELSLSSHERQMNLYHELGSVKVHGNVELHTLTRAHLTIVGSIMQKGIGFYNSLSLTSYCINSYLS